MRGLYAIVDVTSLDARSIDPVQAAAAILAAHPACLQVRAKGVGSRRTLEILRATVAAARANRVPVFANDRADLALLAGCDGVHLGQEDLPPELAKDLAERHGKKLLVGRSTHNQAELDAALEEPLDYLAIGPVFATSSKENPDPVLGLAGARALAERARARRPELPLCAIGGLDASTLPELGGVFDLVAVIGALYGERDNGIVLRDVGERALRLKSAIVGPSEVRA